MSIKYFEDLEIWILARELANELYSLSGTGKFSKDFGLRDQIRRASISVMSNIAEGYERGGNKEFIHYLSMAKGSSGEVRSHIYLALDQEYLNTADGERLISSFKKLSIMIHKFMNYLKSSPYDGHKFKRPA